MSSIALAKVGTKNAEQVVLLDSNGDQVSSFGGGTQYADGTASATPTGTQINWNDAGTQRAVSAAKPLPVTASIDTTGLATSTKQDTIIGHVDGIETTLGSIKTAVETIDNAIAGTEMQVDVITMPTTTVQATDLDIRPLVNTDVVTAELSAVDNAVLDTIDAVLDTIKTDTGNIVTAVQLIDNAISGSEMQVDVVASLPAGTNAIGKLAANSGVDIGDVDVTSAVITGGAVAHDGADSGNPIKIGGRATNAEIAAVANNDRSDLVTTLTGKLITFPFTNPENIVSGVTSAMTGTTSTSVIAAPAAGLRNYITQITVGNSHATVGTFVNIQDGSGGTTIWTIPAAAVYGGATINFDPPLRQPTTATALYCACVTTGSNTIVAANGFKAA